MPAPRPEDPVARLEAVVDALARHVVELPFRTGRAITWIEEALAPARGQLSGPELRRLVLAIRCAVGIEALVWLTDIAGLSRQEAIEVMRWSARSLLPAALAEQAAASNSRG